MSRNGKNNHYHYAEKFSDRNRRSAAGKRAFMPFKSVIISLVVLLMFGLTCTTFSVYVDDNPAENETQVAGLIGEIRSIKASRDIAFTGAEVDLAASGLTINAGTKYFFFDASLTNWSDVQLFVGRGTSSGYTAVYPMTHISDTDLYFYSFDSWTDATYIRFTTGCSGWATGDWGSDNKPANGNYTGAYTGNYTFNGGDVYCWEPASTLSDAPVPTYTEKGFDYYNYEQTIHSYTKNANTNGNYSQINDGGLISGSGKKLNGNSSSTNSTEADGKVICAKTSTVTLTASPAVGYRFVGWYDGNDNALSNGSNGYTIGTNAQGKPTISYKVTDAREIRARFIKTYTVSISKYPSNYSGSAPTVNGNTGSATVDIGSSVTLASNAPTGVTAVWKRDSASGSTVTSPYTPTDNTTLYCCYSLNAPTISSFSYNDNYYVENGSAMAPSSTVTKATSGSTLSYSYSVRSSPSDGNYTLTTSGANNGYFSATIAGKYKVRLMVTESYGNLTSTNYMEYEIKVKPTAVTAEDVGSIADKYNSGSGTADSPWKVPANRVEFNIHTFIKEGRVDTDCTYTWTRTEGNYTYTPATSAVSRNGGNVSAVVDTDETEVTDYASTNGVIHNTVFSNNDNEGWYYKVSITKTRNSVTSAAYDCYFYYGVTEDFLIVTKFDFSQFNDNEGEEVQKIYAEENGIDHISADYDVGGTKFKTMLWFSKNNIEFSKVAVWTLANNPIQIPDGIFAGEHYPLPDDSAHRTDTLIRTLSTIARNNVNLMSTTGPKWFRGYIDDYNNPRIAAQTPDIHNSIKDTNDLYTIRHTTVGTASSSADRPVYYNDSTGNTYPNTRVMAFYVLEDEDVVRYQTAQKITGTRYQYRFYVPANTKYITFAHVADNNYLLPTFGNNTFTYAASSDVLKAWSETINLSANPDKCLYTANDSTSNSGINNYTGTLGNFN